MAKPLPCEHNPLKRCADCTKKRNSEARRADYQERPDMYRERARRYRRSPEAKEKKNAWSRAYNAANREEVSRKSKQWRAANPESYAAIRHRAQEKRQGIVWADGENATVLFERQNGMCAVCNRDLRDIEPRDRHTDHDHSIVDQPNVRGLLCKHCNLGLGHFGDGVEKLIRAITYLTSWQSRRTTRNHSQPAPEPADSQ